MKSVAFHFSTKKLPCIWATFDRNHVTKNFKKSPNLVTLLAIAITTERNIMSYWSKIKTLFMFIHVRSEPV